MSTNFWKVPAWELPMDRVAQVELLRLHNSDFISEDGWPASFWHYVQGRRSLNGDKAQHIIQLFQGLSLGEPARCHIPKWGLAFFDKERLLFTTTLCFECSNVYVYTACGKELRAFDASELHAKKLLVLLKQELPLQSTSMDCKVSNT